MADSNLRLKITSLADTSGLTAMERALKALNIERAKLYAGFAAAGGNLFGIEPSKVVRAVGMTNQLKKSLMSLVGSLRTVDGSSTASSHSLRVLSERIKEAATNTDLAASRYKSLRESFLSAASALDAQAAKLEENAFASNTYSRSIAEATRRQKEFNASLAAQFDPAGRGGLRRVSGLQGNLQSAGREPDRFSSPSLKMTPTWFMAPGTTDRLVRVSGGVNNLASEMENLANKQSKVIRSSSKLQNANQTAGDSMLMLSSASQGLLTGFSAMALTTDVMSGDVENLANSFLGFGLSMIFMGFAIAKIAIPMAGLAVLIQTVASKLVAIDKERKAFDNLKKSMTAAGFAAADFSLITNEVKVAADTLGAPLEDMAKLAGALVTTGLIGADDESFLGTLIGIGKAAKVTGLSMEAFVDTIFGLVKPGEFVVGNLDDFRGSLNKIIPLFMQGETAEEQLIFATELYAKVAGSGINASDRFAVVSGFLAEQFSKVSLESLEAKTGLSGLAEGLGKLLGVEPDIDPFAEKSAELLKDLMDGSLSADEALAELGKEYTLFLTNAEVIASTKGPAAKRIYTEMKAEVDGLMDSILAVIEAQKLFALQPQINRAVQDARGGAEPDPDYGAPSTPYVPPPPATSGGAVPSMSSNVFFSEADAIAAFMSGKVKSGQIIELHVDFNLDGKILADEILRIPIEALFDSNPGG